MSVRDYCIPDPPLECPRCDGVLSGWETRNEGSLYSVWQQGVAAPIAQKFDPELALPLERRAQLRIGLFSESESLFATWLGLVIVVAAGVAISEFFIRS